MQGQYSIFDINEKKRPCEYSWQRYIGQKVIVCGVLGVIKDIEAYYTIVEANDRLYAGTPTTCYPV